MSTSLSNRAHGAIGSMLRATIICAIVAAALLLIPAGAQAAFNVGSFSVNPSTKQAGAHPNLSVQFSRTGTNSEDLRDFSIDYAAGQLFNPQAATTKCTNAQFSSDACPAASQVGSMTVNANIEILYFSAPTVAQGSIYVLEPNGADHATLGYITRPLGFAKAFSKQSLKINTGSDGSQRTVTTNIPNSQALVWSRFWGSTNIAITRLTFNFQSRANATKSGPYFTLNPTSCATSTTKLSATSYQGVAKSATYNWTPSGCTTVPFSPSMSVAMDNTAGGAYTGGTFTVNIPQADATTQHSALKSASVLLPTGSGLNFALLGTYEAGCTEAELLADACPEATAVGEASAVVPFYPPAFSGEVYLMDPIGLEIYGAVVLRGPRGMRSIIRFTNSVQGAGGNSRVLSTWDYVPQFPFSQFQMHITQPLIKNPACPAGPQTTNATFTGYSGRVATATPTYSTTCGGTPPAAPVITSPVDGSATNDNTPTVSGTAEPDSTVTVQDDGVNIGTSTADAAGDWTFTPAGTIGEGASSLTATAANADGTGPASAAVIVNVDSVAPVPPVILTPLDGEVDGSPKPLISGTAESGSVVTAYRAGSVVLCSATASATGSFSCTSSLLAPGTHVLTAVACDSAGNCSAASAPVVYGASAPPGATINSPASGTVTNDNTPAFSGTSPASATITVLSGSTTICSTAATATGSWTCTASPALSDGVRSITAIATTPDGTSPPSPAISLTIDTLEPARPAITDPVTGAVISDSTPTFRGTAEANSSVRVYRNGFTQLCAATASAAGVFTCDSMMAVPDGPATLTAVATDAAGNQSAASEPVNVHFGGLELFPPTIVTPAAGLITNDFTPLISGTSEPGYTITVSGSASCGTVADGSGQWNCTPVALTDGVKTISVTATDTYGSTSPAATRTFTIDTVAPAPPVITAPAPGTVTSDTTPTVAGTAEAGSSVTVRAGASTVCVLAVTTGAWSCTTGPLTDGAHSICVRATDAAGNDSPETCRTLTVDSTAPPAPVITNPVSGVPTIDNTPTLSGSSEPNSTIAVTRDGGGVCSSVASAGGSWSCTLPLTSDGSYAVCATATDAAGNVSPPACITLVVDTIPPPMPMITFPTEGAVLNTTSVTFVGIAEGGANARITVDGANVCVLTVSATGNWSCAAGPLGQGAHTVCAIVTDMAGNQAVVCRNFRIDTVAPAAPVITTPANGTVSSDPTPTIGGTSEAGSSITVYRGGSVVVCTATATAGGAFSCTSGPLNDGTYSFTAVACDVAGNCSPPSSPVTYHASIEPPPAPVITTPPNGSVTNDNTPTVAGTAEANSSVTVSRDGGTTLCTNFANASGAWSCAPTSSIPEGTHTICARVTDAGGNVGPETCVTIVIDTVPPAAPVIGNPPNGAVINDSTPTVTGTAEANSSVRVSADATTYCVVTATGGNWSCTIGPLTDGNHTICASATDSPGNASTASCRTITIDTTAPAPPVIATTPGVTNDSTPAFTGTAESNSTITATEGATTRCIATTSATGSWSCILAALSEGAHTICVTATDAAGNVSPPACRTFTIDTIAPAVTVTSPSGLVGATPALSYTASEAGTCSYSVDAAAGPFISPCPAVLPLQAFGQHTVYVRATDAAGNVGTGTSQFLVGEETWVRITSGPEGGLPIDISHWSLWFNGGTRPETGEIIPPHEDPQWEFNGASSASFECSLVRASEPDSFAPCTSPFKAPYESLDDTVPNGTDYRFRVRDTAAVTSDTALFKVGQFNPSWNVDLSTYQANAHPDMTITATNPFGDVQYIAAATPDYFWGSLAAIPVKCTVASAQAGTCAATAPQAKIGSITFTADVNPNPHNNVVPPHSVTRTFDAYLTPATRSGDAAGLAVSIRAIDDPQYGSLDYGTINYIARLKLRYETNVVHPDNPPSSYTGVTDPTGMDIELEEIPNSTLAAPGVTPGPAGVVDLHVRSISATVIGDSPTYDAPLLYNSSSCEPGGAFEASILSKAYSPINLMQDYQATGCENLPYVPAITQFEASTTAAAGLVTDIDVGVAFPEGSATTRKATVDMPRGFVANAPAVSACLDLAVADPQAGCPDTANLGSATATSPLLPYPLTGEVIGEDSGGTLPNLYIVFKDESIGLDTRIRASAAVMKTGSGGGIAAGDFIRTTMNLSSDGTPLDLPSLPLNSLVLNLHQEPAGVVLPDGGESLGPIIKIADTYGCNTTDAARFIMDAWSGAHYELVGPVLNFTGCTRNQLSITAGPANGETVSTGSVAFTIRNNDTVARRIRVSTQLDDGSKIANGEPDAGIELTTSAPSIPAGGSRTVSYPGLVDGKVYKFLAQNDGALSTTLDQERRTFKVDLP